MAMDRRGGRTARVVVALLAFILLGSLASPPGANAAPVRAAQDISAGHSGDTGGSPDVLPPPSRIHVLVNRQVDGPGAPSFPAAIAAAPVTVYPRPPAYARPFEPFGGDEPRSGSRWGRAPPA